MTRHRMLTVVCGALLLTALPWPGTSLAAQQGQGVTCESGLTRLELGQEIRVTVLNAGDRATRVMMGFMSYTDTGTTAGVTLHQPESATPVANQRLEPNHALSFTLDGKGDDVRIRVRASGANPYVIVRVAAREAGSGLPFHVWVDAVCRS